MAFWSSEKLKQQQREHQLIAPFDEKRVKHGAYEMTVCGECYVTSYVEGKRTIPDGEHIVIPPGQVALLLTAETVHVPTTAIGLLSMKASLKLQGLLNVSGFHVDPGWHGKLMFSLYNAGSQKVFIRPHQELFLIWFASLDRETRDSYDGAHNYQAEISSTAIRRIAGDVAAPSDLKSQIDALRTEVVQTLSWHKVFLTIILSLVLSTFFVPFLTSLQFTREKLAEDSAEPADVARVEASSIEYRLDRIEAMVAWLEILWIILLVLILGVLLIPWFCRLKALVFSVSRNPRFAQLLRPRK